MTSAAPARDRWMAFGAGALGGVLGGLFVLSFGGWIFQAVALAAIGLGLFVRPRPFGAAGVLTGVGVTWIVLVLGANARCDPASCTGPDIAPWIVAAVGLVAAGVGALLVGAHRAV
jgi:hypothetical protein